MKKILFTIAALMLFSNSVKAETVIVIDDNGVVKQQIVTSNPANYVTTTQNVTVVRESPTVQNTYYYDESATGSAILAGVTTAVVGTLLYNEFKDGKHYHHKPTPNHKSVHKGKGPMGKAPAKLHKR